MDVRFVGTGGIEEKTVGDVADLLARSDGFVWIDIPSFDANAETLLVTGFQAHPRVIEACRTRNHVPSVHSYEGHFFTILHAPLLGEAGHVHLLEIDQIVGHNYLITVHGPINPIVDAAEMLVETNSVLKRIESGRFRPSSPAELSYAIGSALARRQRAVIGDVAEKLPELEIKVMAPSFREPEELLEQMFLVRHELTTARTMAAQSHDIYARITTLERYVPEADRGFARDLADQFDRVRSVGDGEAQFLHGVIELYQTRVHTKMTVAMERLAVIAAVTLPITAVASIYGMNVIAASTHTRPIELAILITIMAAMSWWLLTWTRRQGWW